MGERSRVRSNPSRLGIFGGQKLLEPLTPAGQLLVVTPRHDDDGILAPADKLRTFRQSAVNDFAKAVLGICELPFHTHPPA